MAVCAEVRWMARWSSPASQSSQTDEFQVSKRACLKKQEGKSLEVDLWILHVCAYICTHTYIDTHAHIHQPRNTKATDTPYSNLPTICVLSIDEDTKEGRIMVQWVWLKVTNHLWLLVTDRFPRRHKNQGSPRQTELSWW